MTDEKEAGTEAEFPLKKIYEIGYRIVPSVSEEKIGAEIGAIKDVLEKNGAVVLSEESPKLRPLSYDMFKSVAGRYQKFSQAYFGWVKFEAAVDAVSLIKAWLDKNESILRFLIIKTVRENTMTVPKVPSFRRPPVEKIVRAPVSEGEPKPVIS